MSTEYPGVEHGIKTLQILYHKGRLPEGEAEVQGERPTARTVRLLYEGAHESIVTAKMMEERLRTGSELMGETLTLMEAAAGHKAVFKDTVYKIRELVETNPDFGRELRDILCPVRAVIRSDESEMREDDEYERDLHRPAGRGVGGVGGVSDVGSSKAGGGNMKGHAGNADNGSQLSVKRKR